MQVQFRELHQPIKEGRRGYAYRWPMVQEPKVGDRVFVEVEGLDDEPAVVVGFGREGYDGDLVEVRRLATPKEIARSR